jgi:L-histidine Nalpha-methyltransferase
MATAVNVMIDQSQFPERVRSELLESLRRREINPKFHYDSVKQAQKWLMLHRAYSPFQTDPEGPIVYAAVTEAAEARCTSAGPIHVLGLGCGSGEKDLELLRRFSRSQRSVSYTPCDVSLALVLTAFHRTSEILDRKCCHPMVCDLSQRSDWNSVFEKWETHDATRIVTFFGMLPNFPPASAQRVFDRAVRRNDLLLLSANLAPGSDYRTGIDRVLPLYDNARTRDWLSTLLFDLGVEKGDGQVDFVIEDCPEGCDLKRVSGYFCFNQPRTIEVYEESFRFDAGEKIRLFFSYRHTPNQIRLWMEEQGFDLLDERITKSQEEGVFLCRRR